MERVEKTKEVKSTYFIYKAFDGTEFKEESECKKYEESAEGVILARLADAMLSNTDGSHEVEVEIDESSDGFYKCIVPRNPEDIVNLNHLWYMYGGKNKKDKYNLFNPEDIGTPILMGYRLVDYDHGDIEWLWFYKLTTFVHKATFGEFRISK